MWSSEDHRMIVYRSITERFLDAPFWAHPAVLVLAIITVSAAAVVVGEYLERRHK